MMKPVLHRERVWRNLPAPRNSWVVCLGLMVCGILAGIPARATISYSISVARPGQHVFRVKMTIPDVRDHATVQLPAWNALYQVRDFAYRVSGVRARDARGATLRVEAMDKQTWRITGSGAISVQYGIYWNDPGPFDSQLNAEHAFLNLAMVLFYVPNRRGEDVRLTFEDVPQGWLTATTLRAMTAPDGTTAYAASNYDSLVDAPVELGVFTEFPLPGIEPPVYVMVHGDQWKREVMTETLSRIVRYETHLMGGAPYQSYRFLYHIGAAAQGAGGGMEHANSTAIFVRSQDWVAGVSAHEFFHLWNVKRIRPQSLEPVDYTKEQYTRALWFAEGVTSTYGAYTLVRTGLWTSREFYDDLGGQITELESRPARHWKSAEDASLNAWFEKYALYRRPDLSISYYNKGQLLGVLLDILIRDATGNRRSLDDVMRLLNNRFARQERFYREPTDIRAAVEEIAAHSFEEFFQRYVTGTDELPFRDVLSRAGLRLATVRDGAADFGFDVSRAPGAAATAENLLPDGPAEQAGVREGDLLLALNGEAFPARTERWLREHHPGEEIALRVRRGNQETEFKFQLAAGSQRIYRVEEDPNPTDQAKRIREGLLRGTTDSGNPQ